MANILILFTIVLLDPFKWINYEEPTLYTFPEEEKTIKVYVGNKCLVKDGCYSNDDGIDPSMVRRKLAHIPMRGGFSFDDLFNQ